MNTIIIILVLFLASPSMISGSKPARCPGVQSLTPPAACKAASGTALMYNLCMETLREFPAEAKEAFTEARTRELIGRGSSLPGDQTLAFAGCLGDYASAEQSIGRVGRELLPRCELAGLGAEIRRGIDLGLEKCTDRLVRIGGPEPLSGLVLKDRNRAALAYFLSKLLHR